MITPKQGSQYSTSQKLSPVRNDCPAEFDATETMAAITTGMESHTLDMSAQGFQMKLIILMNSCGC